MNGKLIIDIDSEGRIINLLSSQKIDVIILDHSKIAVSSNGIKAIAGGEVKHFNGKKDVSATMHIARPVNVSDDGIKAIIGKSAHLLWEEEKLALLAKELGLDGT